MGGNEVKYREWKVMDVNGTKYMPVSEQKKHRLKIHELNAKITPKVPLKCELQMGGNISAHGR